MLESENLVARSAELGAVAREFFEQAVQKYPFIGAVRMYGLNGGIEIVDAAGRADVTATTKIIYGLYQLGVIMISLRGNVLRFQPPLVITREQLQTAFDNMTQTFEALMADELTLPETDHHIGW